MTRFTAIPGGVDEFNRVRTYAVWEVEVGPFAFCATQENADLIASALNGLEPVVELAPADPDWNLCSRGGDHVYDDDVICKKCGHDGMPF